MAHSTKCKTVKILGDKIIQNLSNLEFGYEILNMLLKAGSIK